MTNQPIPPIIPPAGDDDLTDRDTLDTEEALATDEPVMDDDRPLDTDLDDDRIDSAAADERAATEGTVGEKPGL